MISTQLPPRRCIWSNRYHNEKQKVVQSREQRIKQAEIERRGYVPQFVASSTVDSFIDREQEIDPIPFCSLKHGRRNRLCSFCTYDVDNKTNDVSCRVITCDLCPAVAHQQCVNNSSSNQGVNDYIDRLTEKYLDHINARSRNNNGCNVWTCKLCSLEILKAIMQEEERLRIDRLNRTAYFSAVKLQANCMRLQAQKKYKVLYNGMLRLQARCRGVQRRNQFMKEMTMSCRSFRIKNITYELTENNYYQDKPAIACILCIINNENDGIIDPDSQMYRFDTQGIQHQILSGRWNETFMIYSSSTKIKFALTVHGKEYETSSSRSVFLGQYVFDPSTELKRSFFTGKAVRFQGPLTRMIIEPKDQKFSSASSPSTAGSSAASNSASMLSTSSTITSTTGLTNATASSSSIVGSNTLPIKGKLKLGRCSFEIHPVSNVESKCGILEEILSAVLKGARKKWYAVLCEKQLHLFGQYGDSRPKVSIQIQQHNTYIEWYDDRNMIKISNLNNQSWLLTCGNLQQLKAWYNKLTGLYKKNLQNEVKMFKMKREDG